MRLILTVIAVFSLFGCELLKPVGDFFGGFFTGAVEAAPAAVETAANGDWMNALIAVGSAGIVGGAAELARRKLKARRAALAEAAGGKAAEK